jgi:DNA topoisomerase-1
MTSYDYGEYMDKKLDFYNMLYSIIKDRINGGGRELFNDVDRIKDGGGNKKWTTLQHNGVIFYPEYQPCGVKIRYQDKEIELNKDAEEFIVYYVNEKYDKYRTEKFKKNFFYDWKHLLTPELRLIIKDFNLCNFDEIKRHLILESENKKALKQSKTKEELSETKKEKDEQYLKYKTAIVDDKEQIIDNFMVEPPTIFVGRGNHPLSGKIKQRLYPQDITLNIGKNMSIPIPNIIKPKNYDAKKYSWGSIISDNTLEWVASWQNNVTEKYNYARFGRKSDFKMKSDEQKYDKARMLKKKIHKIREKNEKNMSSSNREIIQLSTALFLIDNLALRVGNEKKEDEADTVGVTTLKVKNIELLENNILKLDFLGKDSIRYVNKVSIPEIVYNNLKILIQDKNNNDEVFDLVNSDSLNSYLRKFMRKLTAKVFRTFNASYLMQTELRKILAKYKDYDKPDKLQVVLHEYEMANLKVAKLCNHQKEVNKNKTSQIEKTTDKIKEITSKINKYKRQKKDKTEKGQKTTNLNKKIASLQEKIKLSKKKKTLQTESKALASGTSKINYIDPRITIAFLKNINLITNIDKFFSKTQLTQITWAMNIDDDFKF